MGRAAGLPIQIGVPVRLHVAGADYKAGLRSTSANKYAWVCGDVIGSGEEPMTICRVLTAAGFHANDTVQLIIDGSSLTVRRA